METEDNMVHTFRDKLLTDMSKEELIEDLKVMGELVRIGQGIQKDLLRDN